ncbi:RluA family pseudouridine synthase [Sulfurimonas sp.]|uniref:RluA family pseudouridine synthase n=1 Tax=Sulfurimonas sp. TaxID=2022749 RepID=UPI003568B59A
MDNIKSFTCSIPERLDTFLANELDQSRSQVAQLIKKDCVYVDEKLVSRAGVKLKENQNIRVELPEAKEEEPQEIDFSVEIIHEDDDLLVINKPSGLTVHPAPSVKEATLVDWLKHKGIRLSTISGEERHGIVHRLDKGTSGVMVVAKNNEAHQLLSEQLQDKSMGRHYLAVIEPPLKDDITIIEAPIKRSSNNRLKMACEAGGKDAKTAFKQLLLSNDEKHQLIACKLFTGRTHQIRVHLETKSRHIVGDHIYGAIKKDDKSERILLHAYELHFIHPKTNEVVSFVAPIEQKMKEYIDKKFDTEQIYEVIEPKFIIDSFNSLNS